MGMGKIDEAFLEGNLEAARAPRSTTRTRSRTARCRSPLGHASSTRSITARWRSFARCSRSAPIAERRWTIGLTLLTDIPGTGEPVRRQHNYMVRLRMWLHRGDPIRSQMPSGPVGVGRLEDGATLITEMRIDRGSMVNGLFYGIDGMHVGGTRRLEIAPHLAWGEKGVPGMIPENALVAGGDHDSRGYADERSGWLVVWPGSLIGIGGGSVGGVSGIWSGS